MVINLLVANIAPPTHLGQPLRDTVDDRENRTNSGIDLELTFDITGAKEGKSRPQPT